MSHFQNIWKTTQAHMPKWIDPHCLDSVSLAISVVNIGYGAAGMLRIRNCATVIIILVLFGPRMIAAVTLKGSNPDVQSSSQVAKETTDHKSEAVGFLLSFMIPGVGHYYAKDKERGNMFLGIYLGAIGIGTVSTFLIIDNAKSEGNGFPPIISVPALLLSIIAIPVTMIASGVDAIGSVQRHNKISDLVGKNMRWSVLYSDGGAYIKFSRSI